jgi:hypothetical protein
MLAPREGGAYELPAGNPDHNRRIDLSGASGGAALGDAENLQLGEHATAEIGGVLTHSGIRRLVAGEPPARNSDPTVSRFDTTFL